MGGSAEATTVFLAAFVLALLVLLAGWQRRVTLAACLTVPLVYLMVAVRDALRTGYLLPDYSLSSLKVVPQAGPLVMFVAVLLVGLAVIAWLVRIFFRRAPSP